MTDDLAPLPIEPTRHCGCVIGPVAIERLELRIADYKQIGPSAFARRSCGSCHGRGRLRLQGAA